LLRDIKKLQDEFENHAEGTEYTTNMANLLSYAMNLRHAPISDKDYYSQAALSRKVSFGFQSENGAKTRGIIMSYLTTVAIRLDSSQFIPWLKNCLDQLSLNSTADPYLLLPKPRAIDTRIIH
jgi:hypothetical protein